MLFLLFKAGSQRYALSANRVLEVLPLVNITPVSEGPPGLAGYFNYKGRAVTALDLCALICGRPAHPQLSTRIILVKHPAAPAPDHLLGLIAEQVAQMVNRPSSDLSDPGLRLPNAPHLGPVFMDGEGAVQCIYEDRLLVGIASRPVLSATSPPTEPAV